MSSKSKQLKKEWKRQWMKYWRRNKLFIGGSVLSIGALALIYYATKPSESATETDDELKAGEMESPKVTKSILDQETGLRCDIPLQ